MAEPVRGIRGNKHPLAGPLRRSCRASSLGSIANQPLQNESAQARVCPINNQSEGELPIGVNLESAANFPAALATARDRGLRAGVGRPSKARLRVRLQLPEQRLEGFLSCGNWGSPGELTTGLQHQSMDHVAEPVRRATLAMRRSSSPPPPQPAPLEQAQGPFSQPLSVTRSGGNGCRVPIGRPQPAVVSEPAAALDSSKRP